MRNVSNFEITQWLTGLQFLQKASSDVTDINNFPNPPYLVYMDL